MAKLIDVKTFCVLYEIEFYNDGNALTKQIEDKGFLDHPLKNQKIQEYESKFIGHLSKKARKLFEERNLTLNKECKSIGFSILGNNYDYNTENGIISKITMKVTLK